MLASSTFRLVFIILVVQSFCQEDSLRSAGKPKPDPEEVRRVIGGVNAPLGRFPYMCSLRTRGAREHECGGTLIKPQWVLTAAHCVEPDVVGLSSLVYCGIYERDERNSSNVSSADRTVIHPEWTGNVLDGFDIALIKLDGFDIALIKLDVPYNLPVPDLAAEGTTYTSGQVFSAMGWGLDSSGRKADLLQIADTLPFVERGNCNQDVYWDGQIKKFMICAGTGAQDTTKGDSGGPLLLLDYPNGHYTLGEPSYDLLVGVTSFGENSRDEFKPGVYTRIACFRDWIDCIIEERDDCSSDDCQATAPLDDIPAISPEPSVAYLNEPDSTPSIASEPSSVSSEALTELSIESPEPSAEPPEEEEPCDELSIELLLNIRSPRSFDQTCALQGIRAAIKEDDAYTVLEILSEGLSPNTEFSVSSFDTNWTLLLEAATYDAVKSARVLIDHGADTERTNRRRYRPLHTAAQYNSFKVAKLLIDSGTSLETRHGIFAQALHTAAYYDSKDVVELLIDSGTDVESRNIWSSTPLHLAAEGNALAVAKLLLRKGADIESQNFRNEKPLHHTARYNATEVAKFLLDAGADISSKDNEGDTPLHHAARWGSLEVAEVLVDSGADVNARNSIGQTPLHYAAIFNRLDVGKFLVTKEASKKKKDEDGDTPFDEICASSSCSVEQVGRLKKLLRSK